MIKKITILVCLLLLSTVCFGAVTNSTSSINWKDTTTYSDHIGNALKLFVEEVETILEAWTMGAEENDIITFPTNGLTIDNATNNRLEINENSDEFILAFGSNTVTVCSGDVTSFDFNDVIPRANQMLFDPVASASGTTEGTVYYDSDTDILNYRNASAWVPLPGASTAGGSDTQVQYNNGGTALGGIATVLWDDTSFIFSDDQPVVFGSTGAGLADVWSVNHDDSVDDQLLWVTDANGAVATTDPMFEILVDNDTANGTNLTAGQQVFGVAKGTQASNSSLFTVDAEGDVIVLNDAAVGGSLTVTGTFYQAAIASAASGDTALTIDAVGTGTITVGQTSTGNITLVRNTSFTGNAVVNGNTDIGDASTDTCTITAKVDAGLILDDDNTDSPALTLRDAGEATCAIVKKNGATGNTEVTIAAASDLEIVAGNLAVGNATPGTAAMDGEDFYVNGDSEFDGAVQFDGAVTTASTVTLGGDNTINDQIAVAFNANDEELAVTGTATNMTAAAMATFTMAAQDSTKHILRLIQTPDADADNEFLLLEDNAGDDKFEIEEGGTTTWTLDAASVVKIDGDTTANTSTGGVLDVDVQSATNTNKAITVTYQLEESAAAAYGLYMDLNDDTTGAGETYTHIYLDNSAAGNADAVQGIVATNALDDVLVTTLGAAAQHAVIDAAATINTGTAGVIDGTAIFSENGAAFINLDVESEADGAGELVHGIYVSMDDDADTGTNEIRGLTVAGDGTNGTGLQHAIVTSGANIDAGLYLQTGYLRVGTGGSATESLGDDDAYFEGTIEADGKIYADAGVEIDNTLLMTATVELTNNELDALNASPKELVAAPGAGILIEFVSAVLILDYATAAFTETGDNLGIEYDNGSGVQVSIIESTGFIDQAADTITRAIPSIDAIDAAADVVNKNLVLQNVGDGEFGGGGTTTMTVIVTYRVHDTLGL